MPAYTTDTSETTGRKQVVVAVAFLLLAFVVLYMPAGAQQQVASVLRSTVLRPFVITQEGLSRARMRATEAEELRTRLDSLVAVTTSASNLGEENRRLRALLSLSERLPTPYVAATLIRPGTAGSESMFLLDRGANQGVTANAPVITRTGLVGVIREVRNETSMGMDWTHPDFRASAMADDGVTYGIVESHRGDFREEDRLVLNGTAFHTTLDEGTVVVTSGLGGVLPRGIPIGRVGGIAEADAGWRKSYWLDPFVDPGSAGHVLVATGRSAVSDTLAAGGLSAAWPADSVLGLDELESRERARQDSLAALGDSVAMLRAILVERRARDSLAALVAADSARGSGLRPTGPGASGVTGTDSAARRAPARRDTTVRRPAPRPDTGATGARPAPSPDAPGPDTLRPDTLRPPIREPNPAGPGGATRAPDRPDARGRGGR